MPNARPKRLPARAQQTYLEVLVDFLTWFIQDIVTMILTIFSPGRL